MIKKFQRFVEGLSTTGSKIDFYALDELTPTKIREIYKLININSYRAVATFANQIHEFEEFTCAKIALMNYPTERSTQHRFTSDIDDILKQGIADEIEFPFKVQYLDWKIEKWRDIMLRCVAKGVILRPMLEIGVDTNEHISESIEMLKKIGITNIMTSTGLVPQVTTLEKYDEIRDLFPPIFNVKASGKINDIATVDNFIQKGASLVATSVDILNSDLIV
jgi:deoxyribose-phosphate aldolase